MPVLIQEIEATDCASSIIITENWNTIRKEPHHRLTVGSAAMYRLGCSSTPNLPTQRVLMLTPDTPSPLDRHQVEITTPTSDASDASGSVREVDIGDNGSCRNCGDTYARWRFWIKRHLCDACAALPEYRTICRTRAMKKYGLTLQQLIDAQDQGLLQVFYCPSPHAKKDNRSQYMKLYFVHEVEILVEDLQRPSFEKWH